MFSLYFSISLSSLALRLDCTPLVAHTSSRLCINKNGVCVIVGSR
jgi:hypothetical protein